MKKIYLYCIILSLFAACQKESLENSPTILDNQNEGIVLNEIKFSELPKNLDGLFDEKQKIIGKGKSSEVTFGPLDTNVPIKEIIDHSGKKTYTFAIKADKKVSDSSYYFDNLVVSVSDNSQMEYIARYEPTKEWLDFRYGDFNTYSGKITFYNLDGSIMNALKLENGISKSGLSETRVQCHLVLESTKIICNQLIDANGEPIGEPHCLTTYNYGFECSLGGDTGGNDDTQGPPKPEQVGGSWTPPTLPELEENDYTFKVERDSSFMAIDKINCTYERLMDGQSIPNALVDFFGEDALFDVTFNVVEDLNCNGNTNVTGCNTPLLGDAYRIDIDKDYINDPNTPTIFLAQTLIHESFHAKLFADVKKNIDSNISNDIEFKELYKKYREHKNWDHEMMAEAYTEMMQTALKEVHPQLNDDQFINHGNSLDPSYWNWDKFYEVLSYRGLQNTESGIIYYSNNEEDIRDYTNDSEALSTKNPNCNG